MNQPSYPAEAQFWNCNLSKSTEMAALSRFQPIQHRAVTRRLNIFAIRELPTNNRGS
jgi:hypothetical protein